MSESERVVEEPIGKTIAYGGFWLRVAASMIDSLLVVVITMPLLYWIYGDSYFNPDQLSSGFWDVLISWLMPALAAILFWRAKGATPGKMILGLKVVNADSGKPLSVGHAIGRYLGYFVATIPLFIGLLWVGWDRKKQGWHDRLANSVVIKNNNLVDKVNFSNNNKY